MKLECYIQVTGAKIGKLVESLQSSHSTLLKILICTTNQGMCVIQLTDLTVNHTVAV